MDIKEASIQELEAAIEAKKLEEEQKYENRSKKALATINNLLEQATVLIKAAEKISDEEGVPFPFNGLPFGNTVQYIPRKAMKDIDSHEHDYDYVMQKYGILAFEDGVWAGWMAS